MSALDKQIGGDHYINYPIQPIEFIVKNKLDYVPGCVIKRMCRYNQPSGKGLEDLEKAKHEIDLLIELEGLNENSCYGMCWLYRVSCIKSSA